MGVEYLLHIKKLNLNEIREIYNAYMHEAFPPSELRPFASMEMLYNKNCYPCYGFYDETDSLCAYAYFSCTENGKYALLDYFAVRKDLRGTGIGSKTFPLLRTEMKDRDGLLLEVESVESAEAEEEVNKIAAEVGRDAARNDKSQKPFVRRGFQHTRAAYRAARAGSESRAA